MHASKSRWRWHLHKPCRQEEMDDSLPLHSASCNDVKSGRQHDLLVSCSEYLFLLQPRHLQAPLFPRLLFYLHCLNGLHCSPLPSPPLSHPSPWLTWSKEGCKGTLRDAIGTDSGSWTAHKPRSAVGGGDVVKHPLTLCCPSAPRETGN